MAARREMNAQRRDLYDVLGVARDAPPEAIRRAFRTRAREVHPDVSAQPDAQAEFSELSHAHEVLSRPSARLLYDRFGYVSRRELGTRPTRPAPAAAPRVDAPAPAPPPPAPPPAPPQAAPPPPPPAPPPPAPPPPAPVAEPPAEPAPPPPAAEPRPVRKRKPPAKRRPAVPLADRDTRLIRYASALGAIVAAALFVALAFAPPF